MFHFPESSETFEFPRVNQDFRKVDYFCKYVGLYCNVNQKPGFRSKDSNGNRSTYHCLNVENDSNCDCPRFLAVKKHI